MSSDKSIVRQSILPSLLKVIEYNKSRNVKDVNIYEIANTYSNEMDEDTKIAIAMKGTYLINNWNGTSVKVDFYLIKGIVENILDYLGFKNRYFFVTNELNEMHPGMSAEVLLDREPIGFLGKVHPSVTKEDIYVVELSLNKMVAKNVKPLKHKEASKYPEINKDIAFVVNKDIAAGDIMMQIKKSGGRLLTNVDVFDVYMGENVENNEKSIAFSLTFSDPTRTLNDEEVITVFNKIISDVESKMSAKLRR
jgi:phenylalanyl-tRNA synthetase beta chain